MTPALSISAPWWWFILHKGKNIENRNWPTSYRGVIYIHASSWYGKQEIWEDYQIAWKISSPHHHMMQPAFMDRMRISKGHLVGKARIVDCVTESASPWFFGRYGFVLDEIEALTIPIPCKGALGLFDVSAVLQVQGQSPGGLGL